jgi:Gluconate 2-dehydrogenase subunit 3
MAEDTDLTRRQLLGVAATAVVAAPLLTNVAVEAVAAPAKGFLSAAELTLVDELCELIIPADEHSPGARAAKVAEYLNARLAEAIDNDVRTRWRAGLKSVDEAAQASHGKAFMALGEPERIAVLTKLAENEGKPTTAAEKFFAELKQQTARGYYTSDIGIHKEMEYKGNTLLQEFVGTDVSKEPALSSANNSK